MLEHRQVLAQLSKVTEVDPGKAEAWSFRAAGHHCSPGVHHHAVAVTCSLLVVASTLCRCHYVALGFDGTGPQQHLGGRGRALTYVRGASSGELIGDGRSRPGYSS